MSKILTETLKKTHFKYICEKCSFNSNNKSDYNRHLQTKKHNTDPYLPNTYQKTVHKCLCGKSYKHKQSIYNHRKTCEIYKNTHLVIPDKNVQNSVITTLEQFKYAGTGRPIIQINNTNITNNSIVEHV